MREALTVIVWPESNEENDFLLCFSSLYICLQCIATQRQMLKLLCYSLLHKEWLSLFMGHEPYIYLHIY